MLDNFWHLLEILIIVGVIVWQIKHTFEVNKKIRSLGRIFYSKIFVVNAHIKREDIGSSEFDPSLIQYENSEALIKEDDYLNLTVVDAKRESHYILNKIKDAINTYLVNNYGAAVNFSIIKDIIDRELKVIDDELNQSITLPLYLGLAATMIGIIFGLISMPDLTGIGFSDGINDLITGVKIAMVGSLSGLACTTYLTSFSYRKAKRRVEKDKNQQLTYLQAKLLPELIKAEDTGVSGLKASLDRFARVATNISENVILAAEQTGENLVMQREVMDKVEKMKVLKVSKWNLELFNKLENNMAAIDRFSAHLSLIEKIASNLAGFANRTAEVSTIANSIDESLKSSKQLTQFLSSHFDKIENSGEAALKTVGLAESHFEDAIKQLQERTDTMLDSLYKSAGDHESKLEAIYESIESNLNKVTSDYIIQFTNAYDKALPKFDKLEHLDLMPKISNSLEALPSNDLVQKLEAINSNLREERVFKTNTVYKERAKISKEISEPITEDKPNSRTAPKRGLRAVLSNLANKSKS